MDSDEKLCYAVGFMDCWQMFKMAQKDPNTVLKKAYVIENLLPLIAPTKSDAEVMELIQETQEANIGKLIGNVILAKTQRDAMLKELEKSKIDWNQLNNVSKI